ncbi:kinesin motor domain containing protein [Stylonychia lemnae]|uniref:Kinesin motor domain containing protein n=1 Tax=Stylonychia lemnae TaxID=5949 RepID=A0A078A6B9_STYLE|nr:kinesin motor domain containing protein [Stylonychia lemnae]|eukprot:CDW77805.1 kinesin motor domain containing protein [Stylonychia lemnae]
MSVRVQSQQTSQSHTLKQSSEIINYNAADESSNSINRSSSVNQFMVQQVDNKQSRNHINQTQSAAMESFYLSSNIKTIYLNYNDVLYKQYQFYHTFDENSEKQELFNFSVRQHLESDPIQDQVTTIMMYGQKSTGKSQILGSLFEPYEKENCLIWLTLKSMFQNQEYQDDCSGNEIFISCYEVFLETLCDLFDETNDEFQTENDITWLKVTSLDQAEQQLKIAFLNRKQIVDENGLSFSQSHLILNIKVADSTSENSGKMISFIDLVGFDDSFTEKIMNGNSFAIHENSILQNESQFQDQNNELKLQRVIRDCNDNNLFSIRNLLLSLENDKDGKLQQVLEETTLARVVFAKLLQSSNFYIIGTLNKNQDNFNESLNTLEFCTKFQQALINQQQTILPEVKESSLVQFTQEENMIATDDSYNNLMGKRVQALPQEISAYLNCSIKNDQMSKFYLNNNNSVTQNQEFADTLILQSVQRPNIRLKAQLIDNKSNISINSGKMMKYLDRFLNKQTYGKSEVSSQNNNNSLYFFQKQLKSSNGMNRENNIKIQNEFILESQGKGKNLGMIQQVKNSNQKKRNGFYKQPSERSTGFATNTQITHLRKYSQDLIGQSQSNNNIQRSQLTQINKGGVNPPQIMERTFSEINFNNGSKNMDESQRVFNLRQLENFSKIMGNKSKYDSSFLSTFVLHNNNGNNSYRDNVIIEENSHVQEDIQEALSQFKQVKQVIDQNQNTRSRSQLKNKLQTMTLNQQLLSQSAAEQNQTRISKGQLFIHTIIKESLKCIDVQMKDFSQFFTKDKSQLDACFVCKSSNIQQSTQDSNFTDIFKIKKARFFDLDKILRDIEQKELRTQTLCSIRESQQSSHKRNTKSINQLPPSGKLIVDVPKNIQNAKQQLRRGQSINKENIKPPKFPGQKSMLNDESKVAGFESLNQLNFPLGVYTQQPMQNSHFNKSRY